MADNKQLVKTIETLKESLRRKQDKLESSFNIKTINGIDVLGSGNIVISTEGTLNTEAPLYYDSTTKKLTFNSSEAATAMGLKSAAYANATDFLSKDASVVFYTAQTLTNAQKAQARANIGAGTSNFSGNYNDLINKPTIPNENDFVHITGDETIYGIKTTKERLVYESGSGLLPAEYTQVAYIYMNTTGGYFDTGFNPTIKPSVEINMAMINGIDTDYFGNSAINGSAFYANFASYNLTYYRYGSTNTINTGVTGVLNEFQTWWIGDVIKLNGNLRYTVNNTYTPNTSQSNILIFRSGRGNPANYKLAWFRLYDGDNLVRDYVAATRNSDGAIGLYDLVNNNFITPNGGVWKAGEPIDSQLYALVTELPTKTSQLANDSNYVTSTNLAAVALSGNYNDLTNKPIIPPTITESTISDWGFTKNKGTVQSVNAYTPDETGNVVLSASAIGAIPSTEKGAVNGVASLGADGKVNTSQLPDYILGQMMYGGTVKCDAASGNPVSVTLSSAAFDLLKPYISSTNANWNDVAIALTNTEGRSIGTYFIVVDNAGGVITETDINFKVISFNNILKVSTGDWVVFNGFNGSKFVFDKIDNSDAVKSVNNKIGVVRLNATDVGAVDYTQNQTLTDAQKTQARTNIGAGTPITSEIVRNWGYAQISELNKLKAVSPTDPFVFEDQLFLYNDGDAQLFAIDVEDDEIIKTDVYGRGMIWYRAANIAASSVANCATYEDFYNLVNAANWYIMPNQVQQYSVNITENNIINNNTLQFNAPIDLYEGLTLKISHNIQSQDYIKYVNFNNSGNKLIYIRKIASPAESFMPIELDWYGFGHYGTNVFYLTYYDGYWLYENAVYGGTGNITLRNQNTSYIYGSFSVNQNYNSTIGLPIATKVSELENDSKFITLNDVPEVEIQLPVINLCQDDSHQEFVAMKPTILLG